MCKYMQMWKLSVFMAFLMSCGLQSEAKFIWKMPDVGESCAGRDMNAPIHIGLATFSTAFSDARNTLYYNNLYGTVGKDVLYTFDLEYVTDIVIDKFGSDHLGGNFIVYRRDIDASGITEMVPSDPVPYEYMEELPAYYSSFDSFEHVVYRNLAAGTYYIVSEEAYGNAGTYNGIMVTNFYAFTHAEPPLGASEEVPIEIIGQCSEMTYVDKQNVVARSLYYAELGTDVYYRFELHRISDVKICTPYCEAVDSSTCCLLDAGGVTVAEMPLADTLRADAIFPGTYFIRNRTSGSMSPVGLSLSVTRCMNVPGISFECPIDIGIKKKDFTCSRSYESENFLVGTCPADSGASVLYFKAALLKNMKITCSMYGKEDQTISVFDSDLNRLSSKSRTGGTSSAELAAVWNLPHGEYYFLFETDGDNHSVKTMISGEYDASAPAKDQMTLSRERSYVAAMYPAVATTDTDTLGVDQAICTVDYLDGIGRVSQHIDIWGGSSDSDLIQIRTYDAAGRDDAVAYLPYALEDNSGLSRTCPVVEQKFFYQKMYPEDPDTAYTSSSVQYDAMGYPVSETGTGEISAEHPVSSEYRLNTADEIRKYSFLSPDSVEISGTYPSGTLQVRKVWRTNLSDSQTIYKYVYVGPDGRKLAERTETDECDEFTRYVYDGFGNLRFVIPSALDKTLVSGCTYGIDMLNGYAYYYEYDRRGNQTVVKVPGAEPVYQVYDGRGRVVMKQTGRQRAGGNDEWTFIKYDNADRQIITGLHYGGTYAEHEAALSAQTIYGEDRGSDVFGYTNESYPVITTSDSIIAVTYWDDYDWLPSDSDLAFSSSELPDKECEKFALGLKTGGVYKVLGITSERWLTEALYYDSEGRSIQSRSELYPTGVETVSNRHDFRGNTVWSRVSQDFGGNVYAYEKRWAYDRNGRLEELWQKIDGDSDNGEVLLSSYEYDDMGRLCKKHIHDGSEQTEILYRLSGDKYAESSPSFSYSLGYDRTAVSGLAPREDGLMANMSWGYGDVMTDAYWFQYDSKGQLASADHYGPADNGWQADEMFGERGITYDSNGNILSLRRTDSLGVLLHDFRYAYDGNQVSAVTSGDSVSDDYLYDADGNMVYDGLRGVHIGYNELNLPERIWSGDEYVRYVYSGSGTKIAAIAGGRETYYRSVMVYGKDSGDSGNGELRYMLHPEGLIVRDETGQYTYMYFKTDHLGNTRSVLSADKSSSGVSLCVRQVASYYPFGSLWNSGLSGTNHYLFGGKELLNASVGSHGQLGFYDFGSRYYDPMLGRWFNVDPALQTASPYVYCGNMPICYVDEDGQFFWLAVGIGAAIGAYLGGSAANDDWNMLDWDWKAGSTYGGILAGAIQGAISGAAFSYGLSAVTSSAMMYAHGTKGIGRALRWISLATSGVKTFAAGSALIHNFDDGMDILRGNYLYSGSSLFQKIGQGFSRSTWERPQQWSGLTYSLGRKGFMDDISVDYFYGATVIDQVNSNAHKGMTLGNMINGWRVTERGMVYHEYGHTIQSRRFGPLYLPVVGVPSLMNAKFGSNHNYKWYEKQANFNSYFYFGSDEWYKHAGNEYKKYGQIKYSLL